MPSQAALEMQPALQDAFDSLEAAVSRVMHEARRTLDVSCLSTFAMRWLIPRLFEFQERHPEIEVRMTADDGPVDFARQRFDVAIRVGTGPWGTAKAFDLFPDVVGPVLSPKLLGEAKTVEWESLAEMPFLHTKTRRTAWHDWCRQDDLPLPDGGREFEHFYFLLEAATAGLGMAIAPEVLVKDDLLAGRLVAPLGFRPSGQTYVALTPKDAGRDADVFVVWLMNHSTGSS